MRITYNPRVSGGFVHHCMDDMAVSKCMQELNLTKEEAHDLVKSILIVGLRDYEVDINKTIKDSIQVACGT